MATCYRAVSSMLVTCCNVSRCVASKSAESRQEISVMWFEFNALNKRPVQLVIFRTIV